MCPINISYTNTIIPPLPITNTLYQPICHSIETNALTGSPLTGKLQISRGLRHLLRHHLLGRKGQAQPLEARLAEGIEVVLDSPESGFTMGLPWVYPGFTLGLLWVYYGCIWFYTDDNEIIPGY